MFKHFVALFLNLEYLHIQNITQNALTILNDVHASKADLSVSLRQEQRTYKAMVT